MVCGLADVSKLLVKSRSADWRSSLVPRPSLLGIFKSHVGRKLNDTHTFKMLGCHFNGGHLATCKGSMRVSFVDVPMEQVDHRVAFDYFRFRQWL